MSVIAKFTCQSVKKYKAGAGEGGVTIYGEEVELTPVYGDANKPWSQYTPSGLLKMSITNPAACGQFEPGKDYFVEIKLAE